MGFPVMTFTALPLLHLRIRLTLQSKYLWIFLSTLVTKKIFENISDVGMEKEQKQELGWRVSVLPIPAFHCTLCTCNT